MKYRITDTLTLTVHDDGTFDESEACNLLAIAGGLEHMEAESQGDANVFRGLDGTRYWIPKPAVKDPDYSSYINDHIIRLHPLHNKAFAQALVLRLGIQVSPVTFINGDLAGLWRAEYTPGYGTHDYQQYGWPSGNKEPVTEQSHDIVKAICMAAMRISGFMQRAYLLKRPEEETALVYISDRTAQYVTSQTDDAEYLVAVPELDEYAITGISAKDAEALIARLRD